MSRTREALERYDDAGILVLTLVEGSGEEGDGTDKKRSYLMGGKEGEGREG